jgi:hypothetical protein
MKAALARPELWLLVATSLGLWWWISPPAAKQFTQPIESPAARLQPALRLDRCSLKRDYSNARLDLEITYRNDSPRPLILQAPSVQLLASDKQQVPPFVLPTEPPPQVAARSQASLRLRYWLSEAQLQGTLHLDILGQRVQIKGSQPLALQALPNQQARQWDGPIGDP